MTYRLTRERLRSFGTGTRFRLLYRIDAICFGGPRYLRCREYGSVRKLGPEGESHMRFIFGIIVGGLLTVGGAYVVEHDVGRGRTDGELGRRREEFGQRVRARA